MTDKNQLEKLFNNHGFTDFKWIEPKKIIISQWVRFKCIFGCNSYGKNGTCPPNVPSIPECREFISEYKNIVVFHFEKKLENPEDRQDFSKNLNHKLLKLEREVFLLGNQKAFLLFMDECRICKDCPGNRVDCKNPKSARPNPESLGIDVFTTVRNIGYPIEVLADYSKTMNRYAFLLVD